MPSRKPVTIPLQIRVFDNQQVVFTADVVGRVELGRQRDPQDTPNTARLSSSGETRIVVAHQKEDSVSRRHALLEPTSDRSGRLTNTSTTQMIIVAGEPPLRPQETREVSFPLLITLGRKVVRVQSELVEMESLPEVTAPPGGHSQYSASFQTLAATSGGGIHAESVVGWLQTVLDVLQSAAGSRDFFGRAARALVDLVALDVGSVLVWQNGDWKREACYSAVPGECDTNWEPSQRILNRVREEKKTFWQMPGTPTLGTSLAMIRAVVVAPILDSNGNVIGALYGDRRLDRPHAPPAKISRLEAMVVELVARGVAAGLARLVQEQAALRARVLFEQFVTPEVARHIDSHPDLLSGREAEVTLLFCDVRGFSRISERVGPSTTVAWIGNVMDVLSECVAAHDGTLVGYIGDELLAMWGAPVEQPDHAARACRAALAMLQEIPGLNERWQTILQDRVRLGIGMNTGLAQVGNTGSHRKPQYGPLGNTVNLASRVQGATKYLKANAVLTEATRAKLNASFSVRRLCKVRVQNITEPVDLYELGPRGQVGWDDLKARYERALTEFEDANFRAAVSILGGLVNDYPEDGPTQKLNARASVALDEGSSVFDAVWELPGK
jgi:adenylate cyclase